MSDETPYHRLRKDIVNARPQRNQISFWRALEECEAGSGREIDKRFLTKYVDTLRRSQDICQALGAICTTLHLQNALCGPSIMLWGTCLGPG